MIEMHRFPDWEARLARYLESVRSMPFAWGSHDCTLFAAGAVEAMTGVDAMPEFRGHYSTAIGARRALRRYGAGTLSATLDTKFARVRASMAHRGDLVMTDGLLSICAGPLAIAVGAETCRAGVTVREGLITLARSTWVDAKAWRVPY